MFGFDEETIRGYARQAAQGFAEGMKESFNSEEAGKNIGKIFAEALKTAATETSNDFDRQAFFKRFNDILIEEFKNADKTLGKILENFSAGDHSQTLGEHVSDSFTGFMDGARFDEMGEEIGKNFAEAFQKGVHPMSESFIQEVSYFIRRMTLEFMIPSIAFTLVGTALPLTIYYLYYKAKHNIGKPSIMMESRNVTPLTPLYNATGKAITSTVNFILRRKNKESKAIFNENISKRITDITSSLNYLKKNGGYLPNVLLYGPGGTGKTMVAKKMAEESNFSYVQMSGGDLAQYIKRGEHVTELNKLMKYAKGKPTILFIDEAESLFRDREKMDRSELLELQNAFLNHTGTQSKNLMIIAATNRMEDLDEAILSRMHYKIHIGPPALKERQQILSQYVSHFFSKKEIDEFFTDVKLHEMAQMIEGFTGRAIFQLVNAFSNKKATTANNVLNQTVIDQILTEFVDQEKEVKRRILEKEAKRNQQPAGAAANPHLFPPYMPYIFDPLKRPATTNALAELKKQANNANPQIGLPATLEGRVIKRK